MAAAPSSRKPRMRMGVLATAALIVAAGATPVLGKPAQVGFLTSQASMLTATSPGGKVVPIITVGDMIGSYRFESIPDGISFVKNGKLSVDLYVNHETSTVPFPLANNGVDYVPTNNTNGSQNDFDNSQVSRLRLDQKSMGVLPGASYVIPSSALFQRFCSNFLATSEHGFDRPLLLTNEEGIDWVSKTAPAFPAFPGDAGARQIGTVVAYDVNAGTYQPIWGMGRLNHENSVAIPGYGQPVVLTTDDTFTTTPSQSQLYSYIADNANGVWNDAGELWAFVSDDSAITTYEDFVPGETDSITGHFIQVPKLIATGRDPVDGSELMAADVPASLGGPYPPPPNSSAWQRFNGVGIDGPQWVLEKWSQLHDVFDFVRLEDVAYDKRPGMSNVVYLVDSGRGTNATPGAGVSTNGRIWEMVLDPSDPTQVDSLRILIEGDDQPVRHPGRIHQPDNIESTPNGLYITEDPGSQQQFAFGSIFPGSGTFNPDATNARIWQYRLNEDNFGELVVAAVVDQSADEGTTDVDPVSAAATHGFWEASGIIDVSSVFGPGSFLVTIQSHSLWVQSQDGGDDLIRSGGVWSYGQDTYPDWINKREGGQLVLLRIPGG
ncbi:MAG: hypothetical protein WD402_00015 [Chloroflexota bacterium]